MLTPERIYNQAVANRATIGIGMGENPSKVLDSARAAERRGYAKVLTYDTAEGLVTALRQGEVDAVVRGDLSANSTMAEVKSQFSLDHLMRAALMQPRGGHMFFLAPVGVDEGWGVGSKLEFIRCSSTFFHKLGIEMDVGVLSGGRMGDLGRSADVDRTIQEALEIERLGRLEGHRVEHCQILLEEAVRTKNLIIAPDGISGNLIFRAMHLVDGCISMGAPILNMQKVFIDTSRAKKSYWDSIALASALAYQTK